MKGSRSAGFTLLEVLVALALLGILSLTLVTLARTTADASAAMRARFAETASLQTARSLLRERIARALPVTFGGPRAPALAFAGDSRRLRLLAAEPPYGRPAGLMAWEFALEEVPEGTRIEVRVAPAAMRSDPLAGLAESRWRPLATFPGRLRFAYLGVPGEAEGGDWVPRWQEPGYLPRAVRIEAGQGRGWPPLIVPLRIPELGGCAGSAEGAPACPS